MIAFAEFTPFQGAFPLFARQHCSISPVHGAWPRSGLRPALVGSLVGRVTDAHHGAGSPFTGFLAVWL